eukprot:comp23196_c1_seq1/m.37655 comp23196_c1_seq1/g.37655  ORF comp23196_c1_seq1/g.37655 comp23196_c1_seq1/m.37655 type:complete len:310 (+) comp23196_c1_seq1:580-1509(+)
MLSTCYFCVAAADSGRPDPVLSGILFALPADHRPPVRVFASLENDARLPLAATDWGTTFEVVRILVILPCSLKSNAIVESEFQILPGTTTLPRLESYRAVSQVPFSGLFSMYVLKSSLFCRMTPSLVVSKITSSDTSDSNPVRSLLRRQVMYFCATLTFPAVWGVSRMLPVAPEPLSGPEPEALRGIPSDVRAPAITLFTSAVTDERLCSREEIAGAFQFVVNLRIFPYSSNPKIIVAWGGPSLSFPGAKTRPPPCSSYLTVSHAPANSVVSKYVRRASAPDRRTPSGFSSVTSGERSDIHPVVSLARR